MFDCKGMIKHLIIKFKTKWLNLSDNFYPEKKKDTCLILHHAVTLLTTLLVSEIKWLPRYRDRRFQMSWKGFFCGKSPK